MSQEALTAVDTQDIHNTFWNKTQEEIRKLHGQNDFKNHELPLARIKKIMKLDEEVKMISAEAPVLFSKAAEIFISELSLRAWIHTEENKRRTLQRNDIAMAITKYDQFDFLIDIVPREDIKANTSKRTEEIPRTAVMADQVQYFLQLAQQAVQSQNTSQTTTSQSSNQVVQQQIQLQLGGSSIPAITIQPQTLGEVSSAAPATATQQPQVVQVQVPQTQAQVQPQQTIAQPTQHIQITQQPQQQQQTQDQAGTTQVFQQVLTPSGEVQNVPIQLTPAQIQAITLQMQGKQPGQPILIQTTPDQGGQAIVEEQQQAQSDQSTDQSQFSTQPLFSVPLNIGGQQVFIQQAGDGLTADHGTLEVPDS